MNSRLLLEELLGKGQEFNYENFSTKGEYGYPESIKPGYIAWKTRVETVLMDTFGKSSPVFEMFKKNEEFRITGFGPDKFNSSHDYILGSIIAGLELLEYKPSTKGDAKIQEGDNRIFLVHGRDESTKNQAEIFLRELGLEPIVLHRQADEGQTIIEKFEKYSDVGYAIILLTPDDIGFLAENKGKSDEEKNLEYRARQNVIFEFGYFVAKLGRNRVCCLYKEGVTLPNDVSGYIYKKINNSVEEAAFSILKDLKAAGFQVAY
ncbi:nucleotide-binding protein [Schinkia azotoformans]|uniref:nucleotide-binding protein n=2 Tax=Schinkia azotoformans TaxID=1454 RepID=UPI002DB6185C|nr:nucleotide-binding protein [Schinkia azotoformans]MEC1756234.1 nucleotide-binding protein [Schinkia azotoformans]